MRFTGVAIGLAGVTECLADGTVLLAGIANRHHWHGGYLGSGHCQDKIG